MNKITDFCVKLSKLASKRRRSSSSINKPRLDRGFEHLEARKVLSSASFVGGVLSISGTTGNDTIAVRQVQGNIKIDGFTGSIPVSSIGQINISTGAGNDKVTLQMDAAVCRKVYADLGSGRDILETPRGVPVASMKGTESWGIGPSPVSSTPPPPSSTTPPPANAGKGTWQFVATTKMYPTGMLLGGYETQAQAVTEANKFVAGQARLAVAFHDNNYLVTSIKIVNSGTTPTTPTTPGASPGSDFTGWIAGKWNHGKWGGMNNAPAEKYKINLKGIRYDQIELVADYLSRTYPKELGPIDAADRAFMLHDLRMKWVRDNVDPNLDCFSKNEIVIKIHKQLRVDLAPAVLASNSTTSRVATEADVAFGALIWYLENKGYIIDPDRS